MINIIAAFIAALLSGMGLGSGGLLVIFLNLSTEYTQVTIQGINLLFFIFSSGAALLYHLFKRKISLPVLLIFVAFGIIGSLLGCYLVGVLDDSVVRKIFGGMLVASGIFTLLRDKKTRNLLQKISRRKAAKK